MLERGSAITLRISGIWLRLSVTPFEDDHVQSEREIAARRAAREDREASAEDRRQSAADRRAAADARDAVRRSGE